MAKQCNTDKIMNRLILFLLCITSIYVVDAQKPSKLDTKVLHIKNEGIHNSEVKAMLAELTDVYGHRLTGSREYLKAATWMASKMKEIGLENIQLEPYCKSCRGWSVHGFNVEMTSPNYMNIIAYPLAMTKRTEGVLEGEVIQIKNWWKIADVKKQFKGKLKNKIVLMGHQKKPADLTKSLHKRYKTHELQKLAEKIAPENKTKPLPDLLKEWTISDRDDQEFLSFIESEGALAVLTTNESPPGLLRVEKTFYFLNNDYRPLPFFSIIPEHFGRLARLLKRGIVPKIKFHLDTEFYEEPQNNVNIIAEITGSDPELKSEEILIGGHFDSWHASTGATDNAANVVVLTEALRILKALRLRPKRTIKIGLWGGEEQAFYGSVDYSKKHFGPLDRPNKTSKNVSAYLNLDNGAGAIRGIYLQENEFARPIFQDIFKDITLLSDGILTIENQLSTDHIVFDHYNIPSFQFIQDDIAFSSMTLHTNMDVFEYVPIEDLLKNATILAWTVYTLANLDQKVPRKKNP